MSPQMGRYTLEDDNAIMAAHNADLDLHFGKATVKVAGVRWVMPGWYNHTYADQAVVAGVCYFEPIFVNRVKTYIRIGLYVQVQAGAGNVARLGIYNWTDGLPSALVLDAGTVAIDVATTAVEIIIAEQLTRGYYFLAMVPQANFTPKGISATDPCAPPVSGRTDISIPGLSHIVCSDGGHGAYIGGGLPAAAPVPDTWHSVAFATVLLREN